MRRCTNAAATGVMIGVLFSSIGPAATLDPSGERAPPLPRGCTQRGELTDGMCSKGQPVYLPDGEVIGYLRTTTRTPPEWPEGTDEEITARLTFQLVVLPNGTVTEVEPLVLRVTLPNQDEQVMSSEEDEYGFVRAAARALSKWRYTPSTLNGESVAVYGSVCVDFNKAAVGEGKDDEND